MAKATPACFIFDPRDTPLLVCTLQTHTPDLFDVGAVIRLKSPKQCCPRKHHMILLVHPRTITSPAQNRARNLEDRQS